MCDLESMRRRRVKPLPPRWMASGQLEEYVIFLAQQREVF